MDDTDLITSPHKDFESIKKTAENGMEYWEARELMPLLEYGKWDNFHAVIKKAMMACDRSGQTISDHFADVGKMIEIASGTQKAAIRTVKDYKLSRYAAYLIAQNADPSKGAIARAQTYFAVQTRRQELFEQLDEDSKRLFIRGEVRNQNKNLFSTAQKAGVTNFARFNNAGYVGLYGMRKDQLQKKKDIGKDDILDRAGITELAANLFRITQTDEKIQNDEVNGEDKVNLTHFTVARKVRTTIKEIGGTMPEHLPSEKHIKELEKQQRLLVTTKENKKIVARKVKKIN